MSQQKKNPGTRLAWLVLVFVAIAAGWTGTASTRAATPAEQFAQETPDTPTGEPSPASVEAVASDPDFSTVDDPLNGDLKLYTVDDLLIARPALIQNTLLFAGTYLLNTANETIVSQQARTPGTSRCWLTDGSRQPQVTKVGRFFNQPYDSYITLQPSDNARGSNCASTDGSPNMWLTIMNNFSTPVIHDTYFTMSAFYTAMAMDDFNRDGLADLFIMSDADVRVATASDINDGSAGMSFGPVSALPSASRATRSDPATGDFNGDGLIDVAWIDQEYAVQFATVCPGDVAGTVCANKAALEVLLNPLQAGSTNIGVPNTGQLCLYGGYGDVALTAGNYEGTGRNGLVTVQLVELSPFNCSYFAYWYEFNSDFSMASGAFRDRIELASGASYPVINTYAQSAALDWIGSEQAVIALGAFDGNDGNYVEIVSVLTFDNGKMTQHQRTTTGSFCPGSPFTCPWVNGLALGRFAAVPNNQSTDIDLGLQIATLRNDGKVTIYSVDAPTDYTPVVASQTTLDSGLLYYSNRTDNANGFSWLVAGDLQGRSAHLGTPSVFRIASHSQPSVILGAPPMHVDYILPDASTGSDWEIVNFTAVPDTYNSSYTMSQTTSNQSSDTSKTSYTYSTTAQGGGSFSLKPPYLPAISGSLIKTTEDKNETVSENYSFTQNEFKYNASTTTGFGDEIWYDASSFNLYVYPVLGQSICPEDAPNCTPAQEQPLYLMFSGPNSAGTGPAPGATTEWYQPVHEPGNIFSYPWNEAMLAQQFSGGIDLLTGPQHFFTDTSTQSQSLDWSSNSDTSQTAGTTNNHSYDKTYSLSAGKIIGKVVSANLQGNLDYNDSSSTSTLNKSSSSLGSSQGIEIKKPGTFLNIGLYRYRVEPYIFGRIQPGGTVDSAPLTEDIQTFGPLQAAFAVNPLDSNAGSWWGSDESPYTQFTDVALNHPSRWSIGDPSGTQESLNCLSAGNRNDCMVFNDPNPASLWNSEFYWMRGLYITVDGANGPQRTQATAGDELTLQARVYNYSFMDMPADARIQVRFYRQQLSGTTPVGSSVLISQVSASPLPGFNSDTSPDEPNWRQVTTTMDTTGLDNSYQIFWVLVWAEDSTGSMITELPGHGLSAKPGSLATIGDVPLEEVTLDGAVKTFSNNVGYLHSKFYIAPEATQAPPAADPVLSIENVQITPAAPEPGGRVIVSADIFSAGAAADAVHVRLYPSAAEWQAHRDDPAQLQPKPFDVELLPHIASGKSDRLEVPYQTNACGKQEILIVVEAAVTDEVTTATATFDNGPCMVYYPVIPIQ